MALFSSPPPSRPPSIRPIPVLGNALGLLRDPLLFLERMADLGPVSYAEVPRFSFYLVREPEDIETILLRRNKDMAKDVLTGELRRILGLGLITSDGALWRRQRKLVAHAFTPRRVQAHTDAIVSTVVEAIDAWTPDPEIEIYEEMGSLMLDVVARTLLDTDVRARADGLEKALHTINVFFNHDVSSMFRLPEKIPTLSNLRFARARATIESVIYEVIEDRRNRKEDLDDLVSGLVSATDQRGQMSVRQLRDEIMTLFLAGHETTSLAASYTTYLLAHHPEVGQRLQEEVDRVLGTRPAVAADLSKLVFTEQVFKESMRLYPPGYVILRENLVDMELQGYRVPKGSQLMICISLLHRDPRWFDNPTAFDPDRWSKGRAREIPKYAYIPFGAGPRVCIGQHFAMNLGKLVLATMMQRYTFAPAPDHELSFRPTVTLHPKHGIRVQAIRR